jgi:hypothetical protein
MLASAAGQQMPCITSVKRPQFDGRGYMTGPSVPDEVRRHLPRNAAVQLVLPLSRSETLTVYELGDNAEPDTRLLLTRGNQAVTRFSIQDALTDHKLGKDFRAMGAAHLCGNGYDLTYMVFQAGNQGGQVMALVQQGEGFRLVSVKPLQQGKIVVNVNSPARLTLWSVAPEDSVQCTGCRKHYIIETIQFDGRSFNVADRARSKRKHDSFQDGPLEVIR